MSAYLVDREHVAYLLDSAMRLARLSRDTFRYYWRGRWHELNHDTASDMGSMLWAENQRSLCARYGERLEHRAVYGKHSECISLQPPNLAQIAKAVACYEYQACESGDWKDTEAFAFCAALRDDILRALPGYDTAKWGAPEAYRAKEVQS